MMVRSRWNQSLCFIAGFAVCGIWAVEAGQRVDSSHPAFANGSFEEAAFNGTVQGWTLTTDATDPQAMIVDDAAEGSRAIRITAQGHEVTWTSEPVAVQPGKYRIGFKINAGGNRHWTYSLESCGIILHTRGENDERIHAREVRVLRTDGWQQAWLRVEVPPEHGKLWIQFHTNWPSVGMPSGPAAGLARFWYGTGAGVEGVLLIDQVTIEPVGEDMAGEGLGLLRIKTIDRLTGQPIPVRLRIESDEGKLFTPKDAYRYTLTNMFVPYSPEPFVLSVPPGNYSVYGMRGFAEQPVRLDLNVRTGEITEATVEFGNTATQWDTNGWRAGDHHVHLFFHGHTQYPLMTIQEVSHVSRAEGLDYVSFQADLAWMRRNIAENPDVRIGDFICETAHEITTDFWGHLNFVNAVNIPDLPAPPVLWPSNFQIREMVENGEGTTVYTHPFSDLTEEYMPERLADPQGGLIARGLPVDMLLGQRCLVDIVSSGSPTGIFDKMRIMERLWNLGFRFGVGGSSDAYVDQGTHLPGDFRTYTQPVRNDFPAIAQAYREGRTFATNGPLLWLNVNGKALGETVELDSPAQVSLNVSAHSWWGLTKLEIVHDGTVAAGIPVKDEDETIKFELKLDVVRSGWIYARVWGPGSRYLRNVKMGDEEVQFAMTSPVWLSVRDCPQPVREEDVTFFRAWLEAMKGSLPPYRERLVAGGEFGDDKAMRADEQNAAVLIDSAIMALERIQKSSRNFER